MEGGVLVKGFLHKLVLISINSFSLFSLNFIALSQVVEVKLNRSVEKGITIPVDELVSIQVLVAGHASGELSVRLQGDTFLAPEWQDQSMNCSGSCTFEQTLVLRPANVQCGRYHLEIKVRLVTPGGEIKEGDRKIDVAVVPKIIPEPPFNRDSFNEICWRGCSNGAHELFRMDSTSGAISSLVLSDTQSCKVVENLENGRTYKYWMQTTGSGFTVESNPVFVKQDNEAPPVVRIHDFSVDARGHVTLRWPFNNDRLSYIDHYEIHRRVEKNSDAAEGTTFILPFFPMSVVAPANYVPVKSAKDTVLYQDTTFARLNSVPAELRNAAMLQTAHHDRWNESDDFLTLKLHETAYVYVAMDNKIVPRPTWLQTNFDANWSSQTVDLRVNDNRFRVFRSKTLLSGEVTLGGNFASGAASNENLDPKMYVVFVEPVNLTKFPYAAEGLLSFTDPFGVDSASVIYQINAVDASGNLAHGDESPEIIIDLKGRCRPTITKWFVYEDSTTNKKYGRDLRNTVCVQDPRDDPNCMNFRQSDSLMFEAARDVKNFDDPQGAVFRSPWLPSTTLCFEFALGNDDFSINGVEFFYRVRAKDVHGNLSAWSDTVSAIQDAALPGDIGGLVASVVIPEDSCTDGNIELRWVAAVDDVSGVKKYYIHRKKEHEATFSLIDSTSSTNYTDSLSKIGENTLITYKIGVADNVEHLRGINNSDQEVTLRSLVGPTLEIADPTQFKECGGIIGTNRDTIEVTIDHNPDAVIIYRIIVTDPDGREKPVIVIAPPVSRTPVFITGRDGQYELKAVAEFENGRTSTCSIFAINKRKELPFSVTALQAVQDSSGSGNILVDWSHPDSSNISEYQIRVWPEDQSAEVKTFESPVSHFTYGFEENMAFTYQCYVFEVGAVDCFGNISDPDTTSQYPKTRPTIVKCESQNDSINLSWHRPPRLKPGSDDFESFIELCRESTGRCELIPVPAGSTNFTIDSIAQDIYRIRVQERLRNTGPSTCMGPFESDFSSPCRVPVNIGPPTVKFEVQPQPVLSNLFFGDVFLSWRGYTSRTKVEEFKIFIWDSALTKVDSFSVIAQDTIRVVDRAIDKEYFATVIAIDEFGLRPIKNDTIPFNFKPKSVFTPNSLTLLAPRDLGACFRDTLIVRWNWIDKDGNCQNDTTFGAASICYEINPDPRFPSNGTIKRCLSAAVQQDTLFAGSDYSFGEDVSTIYARIMGFDKFGHASPWSSEYFPLAEGGFDDDPPPVVKCNVDSVKRVVGTNVVNVKISWTHSEDECSGTWFYNVFRNDSLVFTDRTHIHQFKDRGLQADSILLNTIWRVFPVDSLNNEQNAAEACQIPFSITPPTTIECSNEATVCWSESPINVSGEMIEYYAEGAREISLLGKGFTPPLVIASEWQKNRCYSFPRPTFDIIHWHVKARAGGVESAWSEVFSCTLKTSDDLTPVADNEGEIIPSEFVLGQNYPNPFNPFTIIEYGVPLLEKRGSHIVVEIFNVRGNKVRTLVDEIKEAGMHRVLWDGKDQQGNPVTSGVYVYRMRARNFISSKKMIFLK